MFPDDVCFDVELTTKHHGIDISWSLGDRCSSSQEYGNNNVYTKKCCLKLGDYVLSCDDSHGDGWQGGFIQIQGKKYCDDSSRWSRLNKKVTIAETEGSGTQIILSFN